MTAIQEAIIELRGEIAEREGKIKLLNDVERLVANNELTEELYHKLCLTPLRRTDMLGQMLSKVFPFLIYNEWQPNAFVYKTADDLTVEIPSTYTNKVIFVIPDLCTQAIREQREKMHQIEISELQKSIATANAFLNENNVFKQLRIAYPKGNLCIAAIQYVFGNTPKRFKQQLAAAINELENVVKRYRRDLQELSRRWREQRYQIDLYAPLFLQWTSQVYVCQNNTTSSLFIPHIVITKDDDGKLVYEESK